MNFLKRAFLSIWGHKAKTIILFVAFAVIGSMLLGSLAIENTSKQIVEEAKKNIGCKISIQPKKLTASTVKLYPRIDRQFESETQKLNHVALVNHWTQIPAIGKSYEIPTNEGDKTQKLYRGYHTIISVTDTAAFSAFSSGSYQLVSGRHINKTDKGKNNIIINQKVAEHNNLKLGDKITEILQPEDKANGKEEIDGSYNIVGIFKSPVYPGEENYDSLFIGIMYTSENPNLYRPYESKDLQAEAKNELEKLREYVKKYKLNQANGQKNDNETDDKINFEIYNQILKQYEKFPNYYPLTMDDVKEAASLEISVDSPENLDYVLNGLTKLDTQGRYEIKTYATEYNRIITPIKTARKLSSLFTYIIFAAGLLIMALIVILSLRGRKHEFGILLAMGEKKVKIIMQVLIETLIPVIFSMAIAFMASGFIGSLTAKKIVNDSYKPFDNVITMATLGEIQSRDPSTRFFNIKGVEQINKIDVGVTTADVGIFAGCSLLIVILACGIPMIKIVKLSPMNVLTHKD